MPMLKLFLNPFTLILFSCGAGFIILGFLMARNAPDNMNTPFSYRTKSSTISKERWVFAQKRVQLDLKLFGFGMLIFSIGGMFLPFGKWGWLFALITLLIFVAIIYFNTESALKNTFDQT